MYLLVCRIHKISEQDCLPGPQSAVTVTETFPDGTSEPESEASLARSGHRASAPGKALLSLKGAERDRSPPQPLQTLFHPPRGVRS